MKASLEVVGESGWYILGQEVRNFEEELARYWGLSHAIGVASGLDALEISLRILNCGPGDKVLTTPISAFATTLAILKIGAVPVFVDCDALGLIDLDACEKVLEVRSDVRFLVPVHLYGHSLDLDRLRKLREWWGVRIVEDCAQSIGAQWQGQMAGTAGDLAATSFYPTKNLGALGDGGAILTNAADFARTAMQYRDYGQSAKYRHERIGYSSRLDELQAALLRRVGLAKLPEWTGRRREIACRYLSNLANPRIHAVGAPPQSESVWHLFPVLVEPARKAVFLEYMDSNGVSVAEHYPTAIFDQPAMIGAPYEMLGDPARARLFCQSEVSLPNHPYLKDDEVAHVIDLCNRWGG